MSQYVIIGGSSGIGLALADQLSENHEVLVISRTASSKALPPAVEAIDADVLTEDISEHLPEEIDGLIYCPGSINLKPFRSLKDEDFMRDYEINVLGAVRAIRATRKALSKSTHGSILLFSTVAVSQGMSFHSSISSAKGAVEGLTKSLAAEFAPKIRVNAIAPSLIDTPLAGKLLGNEKMQDAARERHPMKNYGKPEDVAKLAAFLVSEQASFVSGQIYGIDGGLSTLR
ncbi:SDR family oxidoreductase [Saprospiraceae bacterium]|nr:SDR family oxidoreductase [Saprospiraceae bacterium]